MRTLSSLGALLLLAVASAFAAPPIAEPTVFEIDPVALIATGEPVAGLPELAIDHGNFTYRFATEANKRAFEADPDRYALRQGGACARMGALSGVARPDLWVVHDGGIYLCASESCKARFERAPEDLLERDDAPLTPTPAQAEEGARTLDRAVAWAGGRERLLAFPGYTLRSERDVVRGETDHRQVKIITVQLPHSYRYESRWDDAAWIYSVDPKGGFFQSESLRTMDGEQSAEARRRAALHVPVLLAAYLRGDARLAARGRDPATAADVVAVQYMGKTNELVIDPDSGEVLAQRFFGWGGDNYTRGTVERRFTRTEQVGGVRVPVAWEAWFEGERDEGRDVPPDLYRAGMIPDADASPLPEG